MAEHIEYAPRDSRLRYTKECIYGSFLKLLADKPVSDITVIELCEDAGISRKTFYKYYTDPFDLLSAMQDDLFVDYRAQLEQAPANVYEIAPVLLQFADENRVLMKAIFANRGESNFVDRIQDDMFKAYAQDWRDANPGLSKQQVESLFYYVVSGLVGLTRHWLFDQPKRSVKQVMKDATWLMRLSDPAHTA